MGKIKLTTSKKLKVLPLALIFIFLLSTAIYHFYFLDKIYPGVSIAGYNVGNKTRDEALSLIRNNFSAPDKISLTAKDKQFEMSLKDIDFSYDINKMTEDAFMYYRNGNPLANYLSGLVSITGRKNVDPVLLYNDKKLDEFLEITSQQLKVEPVKPSLTLTKGEVKVDKGSPGQEINKNNFTETLNSRLRNRDFGNIELTFTDSDPALSDEEASGFKKRAENLVGKKINLKREYDIFTVSDKEILSFLSAREIYNDQAIKKYIKSLAPKINREPQDAAFKFEEGKVIEFKPAKNGAVINEDQFIEDLKSVLNKLETDNLKEAELNVPIKSTDPKITTNEVNDLGIKELIGRGTSKFAGSIPGRVHNVGLASSKLNGVLIPPGETFSFNNAVGDVSVMTGYKQAYIIKDGRTVLGDGGGLCQVSTTLFRAALNAGLPVTERRAHSYRVGYYEQDSGPGIDATVFSPTTDFKFKNDTPGYILIQTIFNAKEYSLIFEIYGTSDGRVATVTKPVLSNVSAPPPDLYVDDPTLPAGQIKQIEHKAWGAKATFNYKVERNGETLIDKVFVSNYRPWQAVFMKGTGPAL